MNNSVGQQQRSQSSMPDFDFADYIANAVSNDTTHHQHGLDIYSQFPQQRNHSQMNMDSNMAPQNMIGSHNRMDHLPQGQSQNNLMSAEMLDLKGRLEQQMKLQQLQQLILQQQIELISGQPSINAQQKEALFHGLLTPGPSAELSAIVPKDLVPPMMLQAAEMFNDNPSANSIVNQLSPHPHVINPSFSAPAALAFPTSPPFPLPNPAQPGYDLSPLTSPWILPGSTEQEQHNGSQQPSLAHSQQRPHLKRTFSSSGDEQGGMRKRVSLNLSATPAQSKRNGSSPSSPTSTPVMGGTSAGQVQFLTPTSDTPSPVDLSMPPPAPPACNSEKNTHPMTSSSSSTTLSRSASNSVSPNIAPMTPASILNLRKLTTGLVPLTMSIIDSETKDANVAAPGRKLTKSKVVARPAATRGRRGSTGKPGYSPNLKPLLPGAIPPSPVSPIVHPINSTQHSSTQFMAGAPLTQGPRKTSHKAAEQKRRDSLKTSFDELRLLLPPVPLLPEDGGDDPPLPGSMPPRGPPKGDADGPNRGVSKLALLRCGNGYIRELKEMVERRDREIDILRGEVRRLRLTLGADDDGDCVDLERDVDEGAVTCHSGSLPAVEENGGEGDEEGDT